MKRLLTLSMLVCFLVPAAIGRAEEAKEPEEKDEKKPSLSEIPRDKLPVQTRAKPDPARQYVREPVAVVVGEVVVGEDGAEKPPPVRVVESYLQEYFRRAGHPIAEKPLDAVFRVEGSFRGAFQSRLEVLDRVIGYRCRASAEIRLLDAAGKEIEKFEVPELVEESSRSVDAAILQLERHMAKILWEQIRYRGKALANEKVVELLATLTAEGLTEGDLGAAGVGEGGGGPPLTTEKVVSLLAEIGFPAVPYLLDAMTDERVVRLDSKYPGLEGRNLEDLRVYHIADKALEEIFQKVSRMGLDLTADDAAHHRLRRVILLGWEAEWRKFARAFRESPNARREKRGT
jgi:hypothetical protein